MGYERKTYELDLDEFLGHSGSSGGSGTFVGNWKKDGRLDVWLHPGARPAPLWFHGWYTVGKDKETQDAVIRPLRFNSLEKEAILKRRYFRDKRGQLEIPPEICPFSMFLEWMHQAIDAGDIDWLDEVFTFDEIDGDPMVLHSGGIIGAYKEDDLDAEDKSAMRKAGIHLKDVWRENCHARLNYVFRIVKNAEPALGCLVAMEAQALGDRVKNVISDRIEDVGSQKGNPFITPYCIRWQYDENLRFAQRYEAKAMTSIELSPEIQAAFDAAPPSIDDMMAPGNIKLLRTSFEGHWCHKVTPPWDEFFAAAEKEYADTPATEDPADFPFGANAPEVGTAKADVEMVKCDVCEEVMPITCFVCPKCATEYNEDGDIVKRGEVPNVEEKPKGRRKSAAK